MTDRRRWHVHADHVGESGEEGPFLEAEHSRETDLELVSPNCEKHESGQDSLIATVRCEKSAEEDRGYEMPADDKGARSSWEEQGDGLSQRKVTGEVGDAGEARCEVCEGVESEAVIEDQVAEEEARKGGSPEWQGQHKECQRKNGKNMS